MNNSEEVYAMVHIIRARRLWEKTRIVVKVPCDVMDTLPDPSDLRKRGDAIEEYVKTLPLALSTYQGWVRQRTESEAPQISSVHEIYDCTRPEEKPE